MVFFYVFYIALHIPSINMSNITERHITENFCGLHNIVLIPSTVLTKHLLYSHTNVYIHCATTNAMK